MRGLPLALTIGLCVGCGKRGSKGQNKGPPKKPPMAAAKPAPKRPAAPRLQPRRKWSASLAGDPGLFLKADAEAKKLSVTSAWAPKKWVTIPLRESHLGSAASM